MSWALKKASFWRRQDLSQDLKPGYKLGKETSMHEGESRGYKSLNDFANRMGWGRGALIPERIVQSLPRCVSARLLQRSLFPWNPSPAPALQSGDSGPLTRLPRGFRGSTAAPEDSGPAMFTRPREDLRHHQ